MKLSEFRKLIREEVRKVVSEKKNKGDALAIVFDEDGDYEIYGLKFYSKQSKLNLNGQKIPLNKLEDFPESQGIEGVDDMWSLAVDKLGASYDYYDVNGKSGEKAIIAAVPVGKKPKDFAK